MHDRKERILLIESDPQISRLIAEQALRPLDYCVDIFETAASALQEVEKINPDVIITDLNLPGLSGKDLQVMLKSGGLNIPIIVIANKGQETDILQAFRLGATNFLICPIRETEVVYVVENSLHKQRVSIDPGIHASQIAQLKAAMEQQLHDFSVLFSVGRLLRSGGNHQPVHEKIASAAIKLAEADAVWILVIDPKQNKYILQACQNTSGEMQARLYLPYEDDISALATVSGHVVAIHGEALARFNNSEHIGSVLVVPVNQNGKVISIITVARKSPQPFSAKQQAMLELVAEYTSIILENTQRLRLLEQRLTFLQQSNIYATIESDIKYNLLLQASLELRNPVHSLIENVDSIESHSDRRLSRDQAMALKDIREDSQTLMDIADSMFRFRHGETSRLFGDIDLNEVVRDVANHFLPIIQLDHIVIKLELPSTPTLITVYASQITRVIEGLLSNAIKYSPINGQITIHVDQKKDNTIVMVKDQGELMAERMPENVFAKKSSTLGYTAQRYGGLGISLAMVKEIVSAYNGNIWIDSLRDSGYTITFSFPRI